MNHSYVIKEKKRDVTESIFPWTGQHNENVQSNLIDYILILFHLFNASVRNYSECQSIITRV
jgi:hypothetical protein